MGTPWAHFRPMSADMPRRVPGAIRDGE
jgi:hypothetical protein